MKMLKLVKQDITKKKKVLIVSQSQLYDFAKI